MVADSRHREKTFKNREKTLIIKKQILESTKIFQGQKKNIMKSKIKLRNREKKFKINKNFSESRKIFQNQEIFC